MARGRTIATTFVAGLLVAVLATPGPAAASGERQRVFGTVDLSFHSRVEPVEAARMVRGGVRALRYSFDWFGVEATEGTYRWGKLDRVVGNLSSHGVRSLPVLFGTPHWAVPGLPPDPFGSGASGAVALNVPSGDDTAYPPVLTAPARAGWSRFVAAAVTRYGPGGSYWSDVYPRTHPGATPLPIHTWQIWNEPNIAGAFWPVPRVRRYGRLVKISARAIRAADPAAKIALAGLPGRVAYRGVRFIERLYRRVPHIARYFDIVAFHPYAPTVTGAVDQLFHLRRALRRHHHGRVPLWVSEIGWGSARRDRHFNAGPRGQARMLTHLFKALRRDRGRLRLRRVSWFDWRDPRRNDPNCPWCARAGLINWHGERKPAWNAYRAFVRGPR